MSSDERDDSRGKLSKKQQKEHKQLKSLKKQAHQLLSDKRNSFFLQKDEKKYSKSKDQYGIRVDRLHKILKKFFKIYEEELQDFYDIFQQFDDGGEIETSDIENQKIKKRLEKIFKILKIDNIGQKDKPKYKQLNKDLKLVLYVKDKIDKMLNPSSVSSLQESNSLDQVNDVPTKAIVSIPENEPPIKIEPPIKKYGVSMPQRANNEDAQAQQETQGKQHKSGHEDEMEKFLNTEFSTTQHKNKLKAFLNQRITTNPQLAELQQLQRAKKNPLVNAEITYLGGKLEDKQSQEELHQYMKQWDEENRGKSLMALHQQKRREEKAQKMQDEPQINQRKAFDRETDLGMSKQDSKSIMKELKQGGNAMSEKFSSGSVLNSFI